eukprot:jgi/Mesvir1/2861/Mv13947-RA.1
MVPDRHAHVNILFTTCYHPSLLPPWTQIAKELEKAALSDEYFISRKLYPNVDFYSGLIYRALGFPMEFFTVLFAIPRTAGYLSHWKESLDYPDTKVLRPQQWYTGEWLRDSAPMDKRVVTPGTEEMAPIPPSNTARRRLAAKAKL